MPGSLEDFAGPWRLNRRIVDALGPDGRFEGEAHFSRNDSGLLYEERGRLTLGAQSFEAERRYLWVPRDGGMVEVFFDDGRPFHSFNLRRPEEATHLCDPDTYRVTYAFDAWPSWEAHWRVTGPRKDYVMVSAYSPGDRQAAK